MSRQAAKRQKTIASASAGVATIHSLPPELLEIIFGVLDVGTLCTARLICAEFRGAASSFLHSVELSVETLRSHPETTLNNFPNLSRATVFDVKEDDLLMLARSPVGDAVTHLRAVEYLRPVPRRAQSAAHLPLVPLPNLMSLAVKYSHYHAFPFPQTLRELIFGSRISFRTASLMTGLTNLTSLRIDVHNMRKPFQALTALTALQRLEICSKLSLIPFVAQLTLLTHLSFQHKGTFVSNLAPLSSLARLNRLVHLGVKHFGSSLEHHVLASVATLTSLRSLDLELWPWERPALQTVCMTPFSQLTALRLRESSGRGLDASFLPRFNLEELQDVSLLRVSRLDRDGVAALRRATGLTHLQLCTRTVDASVCLEEVGIALSCMPRLRALSLATPSAGPATLSLEAVPLLTELTRLELRGGAFTAYGDVCLGLKNLRLLHIEVPSCSLAPSDRITPATFFAIAKLPELRKFSISGNAGIMAGDLTNIRAWLIAERHDRGWPSLEFTVCAS